MTIDDGLMCENGDPADANGNCDGDTSNSEIGGGDLIVSNETKRRALKVNLNLTRDQINWIANDANIYQVGLIYDYLQNNQFDGVYFPEAVSFASLAVSTWTENTNASVNFEEQIINELTGKEKCAYDKLTELKLFKSTIGKFSKGNYNLILKSWTKDACNSSSDEGCTDASDLKNGNITIYIQNPQRGTLDVAALILHEGIHAEIYKYVDEHKKGIDPNKRENLLYYYFEYKVDNGGNRYSTSNAQHQHMADTFITPIAKTLRQLDNYQYPLKDYLSLAWDGLRSYGVKDSSGTEGYWDNGKWTTLDNDKSYKGMKKILENTKFNSDCK